MNDSGGNSILLIFLANISGRSVISEPLEDSPEQVNQPGELQTVGDLPTRWGLFMVFSHLQGKYFD